MDLTLVRHGEPARGGPDDPRLGDPHLSDRGRGQAEQVAAFLAAEPCDALYVSPLLRARQTAAPIAGALGMEPVVEDGLAEFDRLRPYEHFEDLVAAGDPKVDAFLRGDLSGWGTTAEEFRSRVRTTFDSIVARHGGQRVVLVGHGGVANVFFGAVLGLAGLSFHAPAYGSVSRARAGRGTYTLVSINECGHLEDRAAGLRTARDRG